MNIKSNVFFAFFISFMLFIFVSSNALSGKKGIPKNLSPINLEITTHLGDQQSFIDQDLISFFISLDQDAYLYVFYQDVKGDIYQLMPGMAQTDNYFPAGIYIPFPAEKSSFQFYVQQPFGRETIWVFASDQSHIEFDSYKPQGSIIQIKSSFKNIENKLVSSSRKIYDRASTTINTKQHR